MLLLLLLQVWSVDQWQAYLMLYRAEEQHMLHLVQPLWAEWFTQLWEPSSSSRRSSSNSSHSQVQQQQQEVVRWCSVLVLRAAFHPNVGVKRLGLSGFLCLSTPTLQALMLPHPAAGPGPELASGPDSSWPDAGPGAWPLLQSLLLQLLPAFADRKVVAQSAGGSASSRQAEAVAALQQQLSRFLSTSILLLQQACAGRQQQQQQYMCEPVEQLLVQYVEQATAVGDKAATLLFLLQALAEGVASAATAAAAAVQSPNSVASGSSVALLHALTRGLAHVEFVHPAYVRSEICRTVLQTVPYCLQPRAMGSTAVLSLLAACSPLVSGSGPASPTAAAAADGRDAASEQQQQGCREMFAARGFMDWVVAALLAAPHSHVAAFAATDSAVAFIASSADGAASGRHADGCDLKAVLLAPGGTAAAQQHYTAVHCLGMLAAALPSVLQQELSETLSAAAAAVRNAAGGQQQQQQRCQQQGQLTAASWLLAGVLAGLSSRSECRSSHPSMAAAAAGAAGAGAAGTGAAPSQWQQQQQQMLASCAAEVLPVLLQHHLASCTPPNATTYDPSWCGALVTAVAAAAAAAGEAGVQVQGALQEVLSQWRMQLAPWLTAAVQPSADLNQQLLLLTTAHIACSACGSQAGQSVNSSSRNSSSSSRAAAFGDAIDNCLQLLCQLTPSQTISSTSSTAVQADSSGSSSNSMSKMELTDMLLQLHASVLDQIVTAAGPDLSQHTRQLVVTRYVGNSVGCTII
jgi:hypothetical protein